MADPLTGLLSRNAFMLLAERDRTLAERLGRRMIVMVTTLGGLNQLAEAHGEQRRSLELVGWADYLRSLAGPADLTARVGEADFAIAALETELESAEDVWARVHGATAARRVALGAAVFDPRRPLSLDQLLEQAAADLVPRAARA
jgi:GGDEF domain-containing protein